MAEKIKGGEGLSNSNATKSVYSYFDKNGRSVFITKEIYERQRKIILFPYSTNRYKAVVKPKKIAQITLLGWSNLSMLPKELRLSPHYSFLDKPMKQLISLIGEKFESVSRVTIGIKLNSRFAKTEFVFNWLELEKFLNSIQTDKQIYHFSSTQPVQNPLSPLAGIILEKKLLSAELDNFLKSYVSLQEIQQVQ